MNSPQKDDPQPNKQRVINLAIAGLLGQVGCITLLIVLGALFLGLWLDSQFHTRPILTIVLIIASIPVSLLVMFAIVRTGLSRIKPQRDEKKQDQKEE